MLFGTGNTVTITNGGALLMLNSLRPVLPARALLVTPTATTICLLLHLMNGSRLSHRFVRIEHAVGRDALHLVICTYHVAHTFVASKKEKIYQYTYTCRYALIHTH